MAFLWLCSAPFPSGHRQGIHSNERTHGLLGEPFGHPPAAQSMFFFNHAAIIHKTKRDASRFGLGLDSYKIFCVAPLHPPSVYV